MTQYVITGASGHIGNNLVRLINKTEPQAKITVLTRRKIDKELAETTYQQIIGDICNKKFLSQNIHSGDIVIHLAGIIDLSNKLRNECFSINYLATKNICEVCKTKNVRLIYCGSVDGIYRPDKNATITEPDDYSPEKIEGNYGQTKAMAMKYVLSQIKNDSNFNCAMILPTAVIGINDFKPSAVGKILSNVLNGGKEFGMKGGYNFVDVQDVCNVIYSLCHNNKKDQYIISGENVEVKDLYAFLNKQKNLKRKPIIFPTFLVKLAAPFVGVLNKITIKALTDPHNYSHQKATTELGYKPTPIEETLKCTIDWLEKEYKKN